MFCKELVRRTTKITIMLLLLVKLILNGKVVINFMDVKHSNGKQFCKEIVKNKNSNICADIPLTCYLSIQTKNVHKFYKLFQNALICALNLRGLSRTYNKPHSFRIGFASD